MSENKPIAGYAFRKRYPLSKSEHAFFNALKRAVGENCLIFPRLRLCDVVYNADCPEFRRLRSERIDFMVYYKNSHNPVCAVELDSKHHQSPLARGHDRIKDYFLNRAGIPVLRYPVYKEYFIGTLLTAIKTAAANPDIEYPAFASPAEAEAALSYEAPMEANPEDVIDDLEVMGMDEDISGIATPDPGESEMEASAAAQPARHPADASQVTRTSSRTVARPRKHRFWRRLLFLLRGR